MERFFNVRLVSNPLNWVTIAVWLFALAIAAHGLGYLDRMEDARERNPS